MIEDEVPNEADGFCILNKLGESNVKLGAAKFCKDVFGCASIKVTSLELCVLFEFSTNNIWTRVH